MASMACEEAEIVPVISVAVERGCHSGQRQRHRGPTRSSQSWTTGFAFLPAKRTYRQRGAQGNALKTILPMGYLIDPERRDGPHAEALVRR